MEDDDFEEGDEDGNGDGNAGDTNKDTSDMGEDDDNSDLEEDNEHDALEAVREDVRYCMGGASEGHEDHTSHPSVEQEEVTTAPMHRTSKLLPSPTPPPQSLPSTPIPQRPISAETIEWQRIEPNKSPCPSPATIPLSSSPSPPLFTTPASAGRKRARVVDGKSDGSSSPRARSPCVAGVTPSPASGSSSRGRKKRAVGAGVGAEAGARPRTSPTVSSGRTTPASASKVAVNGTIVMTDVGPHSAEKPVWRVSDATGKRARTPEGGDIVGGSKVAVRDSVDDGDALGGLAAAAVALAEAAVAGGGRVALDLEKELVESACVIGAEDGERAQQFNHGVQDSGDKETVAASQTHAVPDAPAELRGGSAPVSSVVYAMQGKRSGAEESGEKKKRSAGAGSGAGGGGKGASASNKRLGKKRAREDSDKGFEDESAGEEGKVGKRQPRFMV